MNRIFLALLQLLSGWERASHPNLMPYEAEASLHGVVLLHPLGTVVTEECKL